MCHTLSGTAPFPSWDRAGSGHLEAARIAAAARARSLVLSHISAQMDAPGVRERVVREVATVYAGDVFFGEDLMEIPLGGARPAPLR